MRPIVIAIAAILLLGKLDAASACKFYAGSKQHPGGPEEQLYEQASTVFVAHVIRTEEAEPLRGYGLYGNTQPIPMMEVTLRVKEILKGEPPADGKVRAAAIQSCNVLLMPGFDYVIFLYNDNLVRRPNLGAYSLDGYRPPNLGALDSYVTQQEHVLDKLRGLSKAP